MSIGVVRIILPTDSVKDRLAAFYQWKDLQSLEQAILVASSNLVDLKSINTWLKREEKSSEFKEFKQRLKI